MQQSKKETKRTQGSRPEKRNGNKSRSSAKKASGRMMTKVERIPSALGANNQQIGPARIRGEGAKVIITHSEYITSIDGGSSPVGFQILKRFRMNPGSRTTFNWLSKIAACYESYRFRKFSLRYEPRCATTTSGSFITSFDYDAADNPLVLSTEQALYNNLGTRDTSLWMQQRNQARPELMNKLYKAHVVMTDTRFATTSQDEKTIDCGQAIVAIDANGTAAFGKLFVDYDVELWNPQQVTEGLAEGGAVFDKVGGLAVTTQPILNTAGITTVTEPTPILKDVETLINEGFNITLPTAVVGQFLQDWSGDVNSTLQGAGLLNGPRFFMRKGTESPNDPAGMVGDVLQSILQGVNDPIGGGARSISLSKLNARQGDFLLLNTAAVGGAITSMLSQYAGTSAF